MGDGLWAARLLATFAKTARAGAQTYGAYQPQPLPKRRRGKAGCTPCAAMAAVEKAKKAAGIFPAPD